MGDFARLALRFAVALLALITLALAGGAAIGLQP